MGRHCFWTALVVYAAVSFIPALALPNLFGMVTGRKAMAGR